MVLFLNMHKNVERNCKNGFQYFLFFKKDQVYVLRIRFFMNIMPHKLQNGADMQSLPKAPQ